MEHTLIQPFPGDRDDSIRMSRLLQGYPEHFGDSLPTPGWYGLLVPPGSADRLTGRNVSPALDLLERWVRTTAPGLILHGPGVTGGYAHGAPPATPFGVTLYRWGNEQREPGRLNWFRTVSEDGQHERVQRIGGALDDKCWKLAAARTPGAVNVLVLETDDIQTTNPIVVPRATLLAVEQRLTEQDPRAPFPVPDVIVTVDEFNQIEAVKYLSGWSEAAISERSPFDRG